jgi:hypothetical protein
MIAWQNKLDYLHLLSLPWCSLIFVAMRVRNCSSYVNFYEMIYLIGLEVVVGIGIIQGYNCGQNYRTSFIINDGVRK